MTPGRRAGIRGRRDGRRPLRSRPCLAWLGDPRRAGATGIHAGISDQALFPSTPDPCFPNTSPILRPSSSADFFPGGGRARMQRPPLGRPRGSRQAVALGPPPGSPGGVQSGRAGQARAAARGRQVEGPARWAHSSRPPPPPGPQPRIPLACAAGSSRCGRLRAGTGPGSQLPARGPRRASGYPGAGVSRPIGARGDSALDGCARRPVVRYHGQHLPLIVLYLPSARAEAMMTIFFFLILAVSPHATLLGI